VSISLVCSEMESTLKEPLISVTNTKGGFRTLPFIISK